MNQFAEVAQMVNQSAASQAKTLQEIEKRVEHISPVIQNNSAAAEETSATSQEFFAPLTIF